MYSVIYYHQITVFYFIFIFFFIRTDLYSKVLHEVKNKLKNWLKLQNAKNKPNNEDPCILLFLLYIIREDEGKFYIDSLT